MFDSEWLQAGAGWPGPGERGSSAIWHESRCFHGAFVRQGSILKPSEALRFGNIQPYRLWGFLGYNPSPFANEHCDGGPSFNFPVSLSCPENGAITDLPDPASGGLMSPCFAQTCTRLSPICPQAVAGKY